MQEEENVKIIEFNLVVAILTLCNIEVQYRTNTNQLQPK